MERREQAKYIEPGLWIAAEHAQEYDTALAGGNPEARQHIVRRLLRYRGAQSLASVAERYSGRNRRRQTVLTASAITATPSNTRGFSITRSSSIKPGWRRSKPAAG